ncbi:phospholipase A and acyltransferase 3-like [Ostrea edulis]|uniref:phospholipase A and acyltransferase 3-like n=1 Tax=Ostrea edulis TaxID=37623 RepID=UPI0024AF759E|nr:phospholipase A and acyltransferase 3-like [Ostrea edulis]
MARGQDEVHTRNVISRAQEGDLLEFPRGLYSHWAVYIGKEEVVHLTGNGNGNDIGNSGQVFTICGKTFKKAEVKKESIWNVVSDSLVRINNSKDRHIRPRPAHAIVREALSKQGEVGYNVLWKNCEHFTSLCRYGVIRSDQADKALLGTIIAVPAIIIGAIGGLTSGSLARKKEKT